MEILRESSGEDEHKADISALLWTGNGLCSGSDDGTVKIWTPELKLVTQFEASGGHAVYDIAIDSENQILFVCSSAMDIHAWNMKDWTLAYSLSGHEQTVRKLFFSDGVLYSGDEAGEVKMWANGSLIRTANFIEEVWDLKVLGKMVLTVRDRDVVVSELNETSSRWWTKKTLEGRSPLYLDSKRIAFPDRTGFKILVHRGSEGGFEFLGTLEGHSLIINALEGDDGKLYSGGWDMRIVAWDLNSLSNLGSIDVGNPILAIAKGTNGQIYVGASNKIKLVKESF